jgi:hypothetical protein
MFNHRPCRTQWLGFLLVSLLSCPLWPGAAGQAQSKPQAAKQADKNGDIKALLKERQDLLEQSATILTNQYMAGSVDLSMVVKAQLDVVHAGLDAADTPEKRTAALGKLQKVAENILDVAEKRFNAGAVGQVDVLQAKALVLTVRIEALREEQKGKAGK